MKLEQYDLTTPTQELIHSNDNIQTCVEAVVSVASISSTFVDLSSVADIC